MGSLRVGEMECLGAVARSDCGLLGALAVGDGGGDVPWPSSLKINSRLRLSFSFFPLLRFLPPFPLFLGMVVGG